MMKGTVVFALVLFGVYVEEVVGHARIMIPVNRASAWRHGNINAPVHLDDTTHICDFVDRVDLPGLCEPCGVKKFPKSGPVVETYASGSQIDILMEFFVNHNGSQTFKVCPDKNPSEECFDKYPLKILNSPNKNDTSFGWHGK